MEKLYSCFESLRRKTDFKPSIAIVLGSGLGGLGDSVEPECIVNYSEIEGFPVSTAPGHKGRFVFTHIGGVSAVLMQGRVHYYEGYSMYDVVLPIRLLGLMGAKIVFLTNAAGGINTAFRPGDFMLIEDQISCFAPSPLIGKNDEKLGLRFPDMSIIYDEKLREIISAVAKEKGVDLKRGVYLQLTGPQFETAAEIRMCRGLGADAVGMSTCCEAIAARHMGIRVCGISCISNLAAGMSSELLSSDDVNQTAGRVGEIFEELVKGSVESFGGAGELR